MAGGGEPDCATGTTRGACGFGVKPVLRALDARLVFAARAVWLAATCGPEPAILAHPMVTPSSASAEIVMLREIRLFIMLWRGDPLPSGRGGSAVSFLVLRSALRWRGPSA